MDLKSTNPDAFAQSINNLIPRGSLSRADKTETIHQARMIQEMAHEIECDATDGVRAGGMWLRELKKAVAALELVA